MNKNQEFPKVTISVINYNDRKFIFQAIESAVNQSYPNLEIIITDNNSTDGTREEIGERIAEWKEIRKSQKGSSQEDGSNDGDKIGDENNANEEIPPNPPFSKGGINKILSLDKEGQRVVKKDKFIKYIRNSENTGFGRPHNEAMRTMKGDFILLLNSDAILTPDYVKNAIKPFQDLKVGAVQGKLLRYDFDRSELCKNKENPELNIIDTTGLMMLKNRRIVCVGQGQADEGQFEKETEVFGVDGAVPVYRKEALEDIKLEIIKPLTSTLSQKAREPKDKIHNSQFTIHNSTFEYFDENFFMYKEDVDLAWRLRLSGWKTIYTPQAVAYHGRGSGDSMAKNYLDIIRERRKINKKAKFFSFKHQRLMQIKNDFPSLLFTKHLPRFIIKEVGAWVYMMIFERFTLRILKDLYHDVPLFLKKRKMVMAKKKISVKEMERWFE